ncbi:hypothetical protein EGW08_018259, partial [Elysia chlorotica]
FDLTNGLLVSTGFQVCSTDRYSPQGHSQVASWSSGGGFQAPQGMLYSNVFTDFSDTKDRLIVSTREAAPFVMRVVSENGTTYEGFCIDILDELAERLSFQYDIVETPDQKWGSQDENQQWNGVVGEVLR